MSQRTRLHSRHRTFIETVSTYAVMRMISTSEGLDRWYCQGAEVGSHKDEKVVFRRKNWGADRLTDTRIGRIIELSETYFKFQWDDTKTVVEFVLIDVETGGTIVQVTEYAERDDLNNVNEIIASASMWAEALSFLKIYIEHSFRYIKDSKSKFQGVDICTNRYEEMIEFYHAFLKPSEKLNMPQKDDDYGKDYHIVSGNAWLSIIYSEKPVKASERTTFTFLVPSVKEEFSRLIQIGATPIEYPQHQEPFSFASVCDPDGNILVLSSDEWREL